MRVGSSYLSLENCKRQFNLLLAENKFASSIQTIPDYAINNFKPGSQILKLFCVLLNLGEKVQERAKHF